MVTDLNQSSQISKANGVKDVGSTEKDKALRQIHTLSQEKHDAIYELQHCFFGGSVGGAGMIVPLPPPYPCRSDPTCLFDTDL